MPLLPNDRKSLVQVGSCNARWLVQVKPGGNARTNRKYWQVRSCQPIFDGKTLKHLKPDEVEDYRAAIERGRHLLQIDRSIEKQQQLAQLTPTTNSSSSLSESTLAETARLSMLPKSDREQPMKKPVKIVKFTHIAEQERVVKELLAKTQALRRSLRQSTALNQKLRAGTINVREGHPCVDE